MKTARQIHEAFSRGELTGVEAERKLEQWDDERVELEAAEWIELGERPSGPFPAALWEKYWDLRLAQLWAGFNAYHGPNLCFATERKAGDAPLPSGFVSIDDVSAWLAHNLCADVACHFDKTDFRVYMRRPPYPERELGFTVTQVPA